MLEEALSRGWENLLGRFTGPMSFRLILQPTVAIVFGILSGLRDARSGSRPMLLAFFAGKEQRGRIVREGWKDTSRLVIVAVLLDCVYQVITQAAIYLLELLVTVSVLAIIPYALIRTVVGFWFRKRIGDNPDASDAASVKKQ